MRIKRIVDFKIFEDSEGKTVGFDSDETEQKIDQYANWVDGSLTLAISPGGSANLSFGAVAAAKGYHVEAEGDFDLAVNGGTALNYRVPDSTASDQLIIAHNDCNVTSLVLSNPSTTKTLRGRWAVWGDTA